MKLAIIIVNFRVARLVLDCLHTIDADRKILPAMRVYVVDECSGDGSVETLSAAIQEQGWESWVSLIPSDVNRGFAHGNNLALREIKSRQPETEYVLLLNPDTQVAPRGIVNLVEFLDGHAQVGIAGSRLVDQAGQPQHAAFRFPSIFSELDYALELGLASRVLSRWAVTLPFAQAPERVDWVAGTSVMMRMEVIDRIGLLDESYFLYFEEVDYMKRAAHAGIETWTVPTSVVMHLGGQSTGVQNGKTGSGGRPVYLMSARRTYFLKNHGRAYYWLANTVWISGRILYIIRLILMRRPATNVWQDFRKFLGFTLDPAAS